MMLGLEVVSHQEMILAPGDKVYLAFMISIALSLLKSGKTVFIFSKYLSSSFLRRTELFFVSQNCSTNQCHTFQVP